MGRTVRLKNLFFLADKIMAISQIEKVDPRQGVQMGKNWNLSSGYTLRIMCSDEFRPLYQKYTQEFFDEATQVFRFRNTLTESEADKIRDLSQKMGDPFSLRLGLFRNEKFVGWHFGRQEDSMTFYMQNSGILPEYRRQGLYTELTKKVLEITQDMGFQRVYSRHNATTPQIMR